jgi:hypothetical protein
VALLFIAILLKLLLFFNVNDPMAAFDPKQVVLENRLDMIRGDGLNISH